jgi:DNA-binding Xre family transcriptional regulator
MDTKEQIELFQRNFIHFLKRKFCSPYKIGGKEVSRNDYAKKSGISRGTLTRVNQGNPYDMPISTIYKLCEFENITMASLLKEFEEEVNED